MVSRIETWKKLSLPLLLITFAACASDGPSAPETAPADGDALLLEVAPAGGSSGIALDAVVTLQFDDAMDPAMSAYADLHLGDLAGSKVPGAWAWLDGHTVLRFIPSGGLQPATTYAIHVAGGMLDAGGHVADVGLHGAEMGGEWATDAMMGGIMGEHMGPADHMGGAWDHPSNGSHGMVFTFTTGG